MQNQTPPSVVPENSFTHRFRGENPLKALLYLYHQDVYKLILAVVFFAIKTSPVWAMPILTAAIINVISQPDQHSISELWGYAALLAVFLVQNIPTHYLFVRFLSMASRNMERNLRSGLVIRLQHLSMDFYFHSGSGVLQSKLMRDVEMIQQLTQLLFENVPGAFLSMGVAITVTAIRAPWFLLFFLITVPAAVIVFRTARRPLQKHNLAFRQDIEAMSNRLSEMIRLIPITRAHGLEQEEIERVEQYLTEVKSSGMRLDSINAVFGAIAWVTFRSFDVLCLLVASYVAYKQLLPLSVGDVVLLTGFFSNLTSAVLQITNIVPQIAKGFESVRSVGEILEYPDIEQNEGKLPVKQVTGHFLFDKMSFSYPRTADASLRDICLEVQPGETIAFVGHSGAGKSTLLNLVIGFLRPVSGRILLDGQDMETLDLCTYRHFISVVPQETILFGGTIRDNICYGIGEIGDDKVWAAVESANAHDFIRSLPQGLDTIVGENGARLSGGQKQRIAIARALVRDPRVLLLDEATSALDTASELMIQQALERLMKGRTTFVVAHRLSTIKNANRIVVMEQGGIVEIGTHDELMKKQGTYARLHSVGAMPY